MWPFNKQKERADKLEEQLNELLEEKRAKEKEEQQIKDAIAEKERLAEEQKAREEAAKNLATERGEPYINIVNIDMDQDTGATVGAIEMDWNEHFIKMLQQNGYVGVSDEDAVDQWFRDVCKHVVLETFENDPAQTSITREDLGDGRAEYS